MPHPGKADSGLSYSTVAASAYAAYRNALDGIDRMGRKMPDYVNLDEDYQESMEDMVAFAEEQLEPLSGMLAQDIAGKFYERFRASCMLNDPWSSLPKKEKAAWEAMTRHIANVYQSDGADLTEHEEHWHGWAEKQVLKMLE